MITLKNNIKEHVLNLTKFPDNTIQVWNLPPEILSGKVTVIWHYENSDEIVAIFQLSSLLKNKKHQVSELELIVPFFPYSRQDKNVTNDSTFGLHTILWMMDRTLNFDTIVTYDIHNAVPFLNRRNFQLRDVNPQVKEALNLSKADLVCFPDAGAAKRGYDLNVIPSFHLSKTRDQSTGNITGMKCDLPLNLDGKRILIVDDLVDAGGTFKKAAKILKEMGAAKVDLYVTHGLFTQGVHTLLTGGIDHIYTTDSYITKAKLTDAVTVLKLDI